MDSGSLKAAAVALRAIAEGEDPKAHLDALKMKNGGIPVELVSIVHQFSQELERPGRDHFGQLLAVTHDGWQRSFQDLVASLEQGDVLGAMNACITMQAFRPGIARNVYLRKSAAVSKLGKVPGAHWLQAIHKRVSQGETLNAATVAMKAADESLPDPSSMRKKYRKVYPR